MTDKIQPQVLDRAAWQKIIAQHDHRVFVALLARRIAPDLARDIVQETWLKLFEKHQRGELARLELPGFAIRQALFIVRHPQAHLRMCAGCHEQLVVFARAQDLMHEVVEGVASTPAKPRAVGWQRGRAWFAAAAACVLAIAVTTRLIPRSPASGGMVSLGEIICPDGDDQDDCINAAHAHGLYVTYPPQAGGPHLAMAEPSADGFPDNSIGKE